MKITLGPKGRNVVIDKKFGSPTIPKDGVTVAKEIELKDALENMGAQMVREVASKTSDVAGDGTTTATVLAQAIFREGVKTVAAGANPMALKRGIERAVELIVEEIKKLAKPVKGDMIAQVGTVSANGDATIGNIISEAMKKVGKDGRVYTPTRSGNAAWPDGTFDGCVLELHEARAKVVALDALRAEKGELRDDPVVAAKDRADLATLSGLRR